VREIVDECVARWSLRLDGSFWQVEPNAVAPATRADGTRCVLKVSPDLVETRTEIAALRIWNGHGAAHVLASDAERGALLIERLEPGTMLSEIEDDDVATRIAADLLRTLWVAPPDCHELRPLASWCDAFERNRGAILGGAASFPRALFERADQLGTELLASTREPVVLHGDLHHFNILRAQRATWLTIDPKGLFGDRCFDICQFLCNPRPVPLAVNRRRVLVFCEELGLDFRRTRDWCLVHAVLDACWAFEADDHSALRGRIAYAESMFEL